MDMGREKARAAAVIAANRLVQGEAFNIFRNAVDGIMKRVRQNLCAEAQAKARPMLSTMGADLQKRIVQIASSWSVVQKDTNEPVLPDHCKFFKKCGNNSVVVLEYKPQVRSLLFSNSMAANVVPLSGNGVNPPYLSPGSRTAVT